MTTCLSRIVRAHGAVLAAALVVLSPPAACAGAVTGGLGFDYQSGPGAQSYRSALLFASNEWDQIDLTLAGVRFGDSRIGSGIGLFANAGVGLTQKVRLRTVGIRAIGDEAYRAWRWRAGPEFHVASCLTIGSYYLRQTDNAGSSFDAIGMELGGAVIRDVTGQIGSSYGKWNTDATTAQASVSGTWLVVPRVLLLGEVDVGRNLATMAAAGSSGGGTLGGLGLPGGLGNGNPGSHDDTRVSDVTTAAQIGVRFQFR